MENNRRETSVGLYAGLLRHAFLNAIGVKNILSQFVVIESLAMSITDLMILE